LEEGFKEMVAQHGLVVRGAADGFFSKTDDDELHGIG
jgi:hypothetical protein